MTYNEIEEIRGKIIHIEFKLIALDWFLKHLEERIEELDNEEIKLLQI